MALVYAVQVSQRRNRNTGEMEPVFDVSPAAAHGEIIELLSPTAKPFNPQPIIDELYDKLKAYSDEDYILCIGNPILIGLACTVAADINNGRVQMLQWHGHKGEYVAIDADLGFAT